MAHVGLAIVLLLGLLGRAGGVDEEELLPGKKLVLRQGKRGERLTVVSHAALAAPLPGGTDDPTRLGARVDIGNPITQEWARIDAPASGWSVNGLGTTFRFASAASRDTRAPALRVVIRHGKALKVSGHAIGITLDESAQAALAVIVTSGTHRYCLVFGGTVREDEPGRFIARSAPIPSSCPVPPTAPTETTSTTTTTRPRPGRPTTTTTSTTTTTRAPSDTPSSSTSTTRKPSTTSTTRHETTTSTTTRRPATTSTTKPTPTTTTTTRRPSTTSTTTREAPTSTTKQPAPSTTTTTRRPSTTSTTKQPAPTSSSTTRQPTTTSSTSSTEAAPSTTSTTEPPSGGGDGCDDVRIPDGQKPRPGQCRIWFPDRSPGHQPPPGPCDELQDDVPEGACLIRG